MRTVWGIVSRREQRGERHLWVGGVADVGGGGGELLTLSGETKKPDSPRIKVSPTELSLGSAVNTVRRDK